MKTNKKERVAAERNAHNAAVLAVASDKVRAKATGLALWRKLRRLEVEAHDSVTAQCNGKAYNGQPFRPDWMEGGREAEGEEMTPWDVYSESVRARVVGILGHLPAGFRYNQDARGYALKIDPSRGGGVVPVGMVTDWGGNGILAAEIN